MHISRFPIAGWFIYESVGYGSRQCACFYETAVAIMAGFGAVIARPENNKDKDNRNRGKVSSFSMVQICSSIEFNILGYVIIEGGYTGQKGLIYGFIGLSDIMIRKKVINHVK